jgi:hypothetical protein
MEQQSGQVTGQLSPDGHWWWDGTRWAPAFSNDGQWWWDGSKWRGALSDNGLWRWDGAHWQPVWSLSPQDPGGVARALAAAAEERFVQAGFLLASRRPEWQATPDLVPLLDSAMPGLPGGAGNPQYRSIYSRIGRSSPASTFADADAVLRLAREGNTLGAALGAAVEEQRSGEAARSRRIQEAEQRLAQAQQRLNIAQATDGAATDAGRQLGGFGDVRVYERAVWAPGHGLAPLGDAVAALGTASELFQSHHDAVAKITQPDSAAGPAPAASALAKADLESALASGAPTRFVLVSTSRYATVVECQPGQEPTAQQFVDAFNRTVQAASGSAPPALTPEQREKVEADLEKEVQAAQAEFEAAKADRGSLDAAQARAKAILDRVLVPPESLRAG